MRRREFIGLVGGAAAWPLGARAQQPQHMRRIGVFMSAPPGDRVTQADAAVMLQGLQELGWTVGLNLQIEWRWYEANDAQARKDAEDLVAQGPDLIVAISGPVLRALVQTSHTGPIVFAAVIDPAGAGYVTNLAQPGGNVTGFASLDFSTSTKWLQLLKEIAPGVTRALVFRTVDAGGGAGQFRALQEVASTMGVELRPVDPSNREEIDGAVGEFARNPNGGLIVTASAPATVNRQLIVALAAKYRLPAVYANRSYVEAGGLISYGWVRGDHIRRVAGYVDRILKGEKPADLPVQAPVKYETVLNLKTARAIGLTVSDLLLVRADEVLE
jgi:putative tryptophan/tyrosine transport system substrate-binding protein